MAGFVDILRCGRWLTRERMRLVSFALLAAFVLGAGYLIATSDGRNDRFGRPLGTDFSDIYAAGTAVLAGEPTAPFDPARQFAREKAIFGPATQFYGWLYPPFFLGLAAPLALMPYWLSLLVWQGVTLVLYLLAMRAILFSSSPLWEGSHAAGARDGAAKEDGHSTASRATSPTSEEAKKEWLLLALAYPAVFINLGQGHNGFLTAALIGGALALLDRRPIVSGILIGCLAYKPQFGVLIPLVLAVSGRWRVFASAAAMVLVLTFAVTFAFGLDVWSAFLASTKFSRAVVLEQGGAGWYKVLSVFAWVRMWGGGIALAYALQGAAVLALAAALTWLWRSPASYPLKATGLLIGSALATPYSFDYDLMLLAPAIAYLALDGMARGFGGYEKTVLAVLWFMPLLARSVPQATLIPLAVPVMLLAFALLLRRAMNECGAPSLRRLALPLK
jgi:Glycosyltransferase family 87